MTLRTTMILTTNPIINVVLGVLLVGSALHAENNSTKDYCQEKKYKEDKKTLSSQNVKLFTDQANFVNDYLKQQCESNSSAKPTQEPALIFLNQSIDLLDALTILDINKSAIERLKKEQIDNVNKEKRLIQISVERDANKVLYLQEEFPSTALRFNSALEFNCTMIAAKEANLTCQNALEEFRDIFNVVQGMFAYADLKEMHAALQQKDSQWKNYFETRMPQTLIERGVNNLIEDYCPDNASQTKYFKRPPSWDLIFMHPDVGVEYVGNADEGNRFKTSLIVHALGLNYWNSGYTPGVSLIALYSDRAGTDDFRTGISLIFYNRFSVAYTTNYLSNTHGNFIGSDHGVIVSIDLFELLTDTTKLYDEYTNSSLTDELKTN